MALDWSAIVVCLVAVAVYLFLALRLRFFSDPDIEGRGAFISGGILVLAAAVWYLVTTTPDYAEWFVDAAYPVIRIAHLVVFIVGLLFTVIGLSLFADFWQQRSEALTVRDEKMSLLRNLQRDAREPYHLLQLLDIAIKEVVAHMPNASGALFLLNRRRRQLILAGSVGFNKNEQSALEQYPLERNVVGQSLDLGEPFLAEGYELISEKKSSRFLSGLVLPLISGTERIGAITLLSEQADRFSSADLDFLSPVGEWLAEKIKSARLSREIVAAKKEQETLTVDLEAQQNRLSSAVASFAASEPIDAYCRSLIGIAGSRAVFLITAAGRGLELTGGSEPLLDPGESLKSSLLDALDREKPLIINQEATSEEGHTFVSQSVLVVPLTVSEQPYALVLRKDNGVVSVKEQELRTLQLYARLAGVLVRQRETERLDLRRRRGLQRVLHLLRFDAVPTFESEWSFFAEHMSDVLPRGTLALSFEPRQSELVCLGGHRDRDELSVDLAIPTGLPELEAVMAGEVRFVYGKQAAGRMLERIDQNGRLRRQFDQERRPVHLSFCPIRSEDGILGMVLFVIFDLPEPERGELERLLQLSLGLYATAQMVHELATQTRSLHAEQPVPTIEVSGSTANSLNNRLAAILGSAELLLQKGELAPESRTLISRIVQAAEEAGAAVRRGRTTEEEQVAETPAEPKRDRIDETMEAVLASARISGDLYMVGGQPREIHTRFRDTRPVTIKSDVLRPLFEEALNRFAAIGEGSDVISVSTYADESYVYLDVSRHPKNFPAADRIAGFGSYEPASRVLGYRPTDAFLKTVAEYDEAFYAFDRYQDVPAYLSFRFPAAGQATPVEPAEDDVSGRLKVLAIDDQEIILDLIAAMCRSLGYEVVTALAAAEGVRLGTERRFDIVLTDLAMPEMSGLEVGRRIHERWPEIPIVLITGWESEISGDELARAGIRHVLHKPFRMEQLTDLIDSLTKADQTS